MSELATSLLANSPCSMRATKHLLYRQEIERLSRNLRAAVNTNAELRATDDFREGIAAFLEKRKPSGRRAADFVRRQPGAHRALVKRPPEEARSCSTSSCEALALQFCRRIITAIPASPRSLSNAKGEYHRSPSLDQFEPWPAVRFVCDESPSDGLTVT